MENTMESKTRFIHLEFYTDYESPDNYAVIIETLDEKPICSFVIKLPVRATQYPIYPLLKN